MTPIGWLLSNDTGTSSKTICAVMTGSDIPRPDVPYDLDDFGRCYRLLKLFPEWVERMPEVGRKFPEWGPMVAEWEKLMGMYAAGCDEDGRLTRGNARPRQKLHGRLVELVEAGRLAAGWKRWGSAG